jgi:molecular chaperone DnaK (HSP70)
MCCQTHTRSHTLATHTHTRARARTRARTHPHPLPPPQIERSPTGGVLVRVAYGGEQAEFTPEQLMAMVIVDLKRIAETEGGAPVVDVALSVPVYYTEAERRAMLAAAQARFPWGFGGTFLWEVCGGAAERPLGFLGVSFGCRRAGFWPGGAPVVDVALSVPVYYTEAERRAMLAAAQVGVLQGLVG